MKKSRTPPPANVKDLWREAVLMTRDNLARLADSFLVPEEKEPSPLGATAQRVADEIRRHPQGIKAAVLARTLSLTEDVVKQTMRRTLKPLGFLSTDKGYQPPAR